MISVIKDNYNSKGKKYTCSHCSSELFVPDHDIITENGGEEYAGNYYCWQETYYICPCCNKKVSLNFRCSE